MEANDKKSLLVVAIGGGKKPSSAPLEKKADGYAQAEEDAMGELTSSLGIEPKNMRAATAALRNFVKICIARSKAGEYEESEKENPGRREKGPMAY
jgi:hypothetical protein